MPTDTATMPEHGTRARYGKGCKCHACTRANTLYQRDYRVRVLLRHDTRRTGRGDTWDEPRLPHIG